MSNDPTIHPTWSRERCLDHLADLDRRVHSHRDRAEWLRQQAHHADEAEAIALRQRDNFLAMIAQPSKVLDTRAGSLQEKP